MRRKKAFLFLVLLVLPLGSLFLGGENPPGFASLRSPPLYLDLNRASAFQLSLLPGLGPARSARIVGERERAGPFRSLEDLARRVGGLGPGLIRRFSPFLKNLPTRGGEGR